MNAPSGLAVVGERGPEIVRFRGGERVFTNAQSRAMMGRNDNAPPVTININAPMSERQARETGAQIERGMRRERASQMRMGG